MDAIDNHLIDLDFLEATADDQGVTAPWPGKRAHELAGQDDGASEAPPDPYQQALEDVVAELTRLLGCYPTINSHYRAVRIGIMVARSKVQDIALVRKFYGPEGQDE